MDQEVVELPAVPDPHDPVTDATYITALHLMEMWDDRRIKRSQKAVLAAVLSLGNRSDTLGPIEPKHVALALSGAGEMVSETYAANRMNELTTKGWLEKEVRKRGTETTFLGYWIVQTPPAFGQPADKDPEAVPF